MTTYTTYKAALYNEIPTVIFSMEAQAAANKANWYFIGLVMIIFSLGVVPLEILDYASPTELIDGQYF